MIIPWLSGLKFGSKIVVVWTIIGLNFFFFLVFNQKSLNRGEVDLDFEINQPSFAKVQVDYYRRYKNKSEASNLWEFQKSFKDSEFMKIATSMSHYADELLDEKWRNTMKKIKDQSTHDPQFDFGLSEVGSSLSHYVTYQFIHSGWSHLLSNMIVIFTFGAAIEGVYGGGLVAILYLLGGMAGAAFFVFVGGLSFAPLIGASASASGLVGFYLMAEKRKNVAFFYFLGPGENLLGEIYLSKWWLVPFALVNDIAGVLATPEWLTQVAYTAHLGASLFGMVFAVVLSQFGYLKEPILLHD